MLDNVQCTGEELTLLQCPAITDHNCTHNEDAGVICGNYPYQVYPVGICIQQIVIAYSLSLNHKVSCKS